MKILLGLIFVVIGFVSASDAGNNYIVLATKCSGGVRITERLDLNAKDDKTKKLYSERIEDAKNRGESVIIVCCEYWLIWTRQTAYIFKDTFDWYKTMNCNSNPLDEIISTKYYRLTYDLQTKQWKSVLTTGE